MTHREQEAARIATLAAYDIMDTPREAPFDALAGTAAEAIAAPIAMISLVDGDRQWCKASVGLAVDGSPIADSICALAVRAGDETFVVNDARADPRLAGMPFVTGAPFMRFYAGAPLKMRNGVRIGTLCVIDPVARDGLAAEDRLLLEELARRTVAALELRRDLRERGMAPTPAALGRAALLDEALGALDRAMAALDSAGATVALAHLDGVIDEVQRLRVDTAAGTGVTGHKALLPAA